MGSGKIHGRLAGLLERGGIYPDIHGSTPREVLNALIEKIPALPSVPQALLLTAALEREALMSTGIGNGIALPHPRNPLITEEEKQFVALAYPENPLDWYSLDERPVHSLFFIMSASAKLHLQILAELTFFSRQEDFCKMLKGRASIEELQRFIGEAEKKWE